MNRLESKVVVNMFFVVVAWWGIWSLLDLFAIYLNKKKIMSYSQTYLASIIIALFMINYFRLEL